MSAPLLVVFAKAPRPGAVKTRLCPPFSLDEAAELYAAMLADVLEASAGFARELGLELWLAVHPAEACASLAREAPRSTRVLPQQGRSLGERMHRAVRQGAAAGAPCVLLRGSDSPTLECETLRRALAALEEHDLAVCPDADGGFNLIGLRRPVPGIFDHPLSTPDVMADTLAQARARGVRSQVLPAGFDIDTAADLAQLGRARSTPAGRLCPRTLALADERDFWRFAGLG